jgi:hypothetical protein
MKPFVRYASGEIKPEQESRTCPCLYGSRYTTRKIVMSGASYALELVT